MFLATRAAPVYGGMAAIFGHIKSQVFRSNSRMNKKLIMGLKISLACAICLGTIVLIVKLVENF